MGSSSTFIFSLLPGLSVTPFPKFRPFREVPLRSLQSSRSFLGGGPVSKRWNASVNRSACSMKQRKSFRSPRFEKEISVVRRCLRHGGLMEERKC